MWKTTFDIIVKKMMKYEWKLCMMSDLKKVGKKVLSEDYTDTKFYKIIYFLKNRWYIETIKKNIFYVKDSSSIFNKQKILDDYYRFVVKKHCSEFVVWRWYVSGLKSLEIHLKSYDVPDELIIVNQNKQSSEVLLYDRQVLFKTYSTARDKDNLFKFFYNYTKTEILQWQKIQVANLELSILESFYNPSMISKGYLQELIKKIINRYWEQIDLSIFEAILKKAKHNSSMNRFYKSVLLIDPILAEKIRLIIKRYGYLI